MITPSPELLAVSRRWFDAIWNKRSNEIRNLMSESVYLRFIGTAEGELWSGNAVREGIAEFFGVIPTILKQEETFSEAFESGETGWACLTHEVTLANQPDRKFHVRNTLIFALEDGSWKIVHRHGSVPIPNMEFTGTEQTAIADLVAAAQSGFALGQSEGFATVMFTDIVNSTQLVTVMGDRLWSSEVARHFEALRGIIEAEGGQFVKSLGDGTMSSFPTPQQALRAASAILRGVQKSDGPAIALRIGMHTGEVVQTKEDFFGSVVNKAARITALAGPGDITVSEATRAMIGPADEFAFSDPTEETLRGYEGRHLIHRLQWRE